MRKLIFVAKSAENDPGLSQKTVKNIKEAREIIGKEGFYTKKEAQKILGLEVGR